MRALEGGYFFGIERVSPIGLVAALCVVVTFGIYCLRKFLSRLPVMRISAIYIYPIKSLRAVSVTEALATKHGFDHDRRFVLLRNSDDGYKHMAIGKCPEMSQFLQEINQDSLNVTYRAYGVPEKSKSIEIPLRPDCEKLESFEYTMHSSPTSAFKMPQKYSTWFSDCFGYQVLLAYIGDNRRAVLFQDMQPMKPDPLTQFLQKHIPFTGPYVAKIRGLQLAKPWEITFADCAPYLICSQTSLDDVSSRLPEGVAMDMTKFRPNIVLQGAREPYQEDYWAKIQINHAAELLLTHNCGRCKSINVDYETGRDGAGATGQVFKKLTKDRRIDRGAKWSPVFGRYGFWDPSWGRQSLKVGDRVDVTKRNSGFTVWSWPGIG